MQFIWENLKHITTPIALLAFLGALIAFIYQIRAAKDRDLILVAPEAERANLIQGALRDYSQIQTESLDANQKYELVIHSLRHREKTAKNWAIFSLLLAIILCGAAILLAMVDMKGQTVEQKSGGGLSQSPVPPVVDWDEVHEMNVRMKKPVHWYMSRGEVGNVYIRSPDNEEAWINILYSSYEELQKDWTKDDDMKLKCKTVTRLQPGGKGPESDGGSDLHECSYVIDDVATTSFMMDISARHNTLVMCSYKSEKVQFYRNICHAIIASVKYDPIKISGLDS